MTEIVALVGFVLLLLLLGSRAFHATSTDRSKTSVRTTRRLTQSPGSKRYPTHGSVRM
jgi:hypothetical protein